MIKYVANSLFATMISFSNEVGNLCSSIPKINAAEVWKGVHLDRRLTPLLPKPRVAAGLTEYLWHGLGFGGSCFPKDVAAFRQLGKAVGSPTPILDAVLTTNKNQPLKLVDLVAREMELADRTIAILGLAFKPGTDDLRESPALPVVKSLLERKARVVAHDPIALSRAQSDPAFANVTLVKEWESALKDADACCLITAWPEYRTIKAGDFKRLMRRPLVIDGRALYDPQELLKQGVEWRGIGYTPEKASEGAASNTVRI
jgi:UDPglucose 6-dehydrogenase/GDP-mannose 6-dehydrogenase